MVLRLGLAVLACILLHAPALAQTVLPDAIAIVADPLTLEREITDTGQPFQVHVVFLHPEAPMRRVGGAQFGLEIDPGLLVFNATTPGLMMEPAAGEYILSFPDCGTFPPEGSFLLMTFDVYRQETAAPGAGIRLRGLDSRGEAMTATRCGSALPFPLVDHGGVVVNPAAPTLAGFALSPPFVVGGEDYTLAWETVGGGSWLLDGDPVDTSGTWSVTATASRTHELRTADGSVVASRSVEVLDTPRIVDFSFRPHEIYDKVWLDWEVVGANTCLLSGHGTVPSTGTLMVDPHGLYELIATNDRGESWAVAEVTPVTGPPSILDFVADPPVFTVGQPVALRYETSEATEVTISPDVGRVPLGAGVEVVYPGDVLHYTLTATNRLGSVTAEIVLDAPLPTLDYLRHYPEEFGPGLPVEIRYGVTGADAIWFETLGPMVNATDTVEVVSPDQSRLYVLHARNQAGEISAELELRSSPPDIVLSGKRLFAEGEPITLLHSSKWADTLTLYPDSVALNPADHLASRYLVHPTETITYTLVATNEAGTSTATHTLEPGPPSIHEFFINPNPAMVGHEFEIGWLIYGADRLEFEGLPGFVLPDSASLRWDRVTWSYPEPYMGNVIVRAFNEIGTTHKYFDGYVNVREQQPLIHHFYASPSAYSAQNRGYTHLWYKRAGFASISIRDSSGQELDRTSNAARITPGPGTHWYVMTASYRSLVETDTSWVTVNPTHTFSVDQSSVYPGHEAQVRWQAYGVVDSVRIEPGLGLVDRGGTASVPVDEYTKFTMTAWSGGVREVQEDVVFTAPPGIEQFEFHPNHVMPDEPTWLVWEVEGADSVRVTSPSGVEFDVAPHDSLFIDPPEYYNWTLTASNEAGPSTKKVYLYGPYIEFNEFYADPPAIVLGDSTTLYWDVANVLSVEIEGFEGSFPPQGQMVVHPTESRGYEMWALGPTSRSYRVAPVRVDQAADRPATIMVSASPDSFVHEPEPILPTGPGESVRYEVYVRIENVLGTISRVYFNLDIPDWLEVVSWESNGTMFWSDTYLGENFKVRPYFCEPNTLHTAWLLKGTLEQVADPPEDALPVIRIHPGSEPGAEVRRVPPTWRWCGWDAEFGFTVPGVGLEPAPPLRLLPEGVPVLRLPLASRWVPRGLELAWADMPASGFASLELLRSVSGAPFEAIATVRPREPWIDVAAARLFHEGSLRYQLVGETEAGVSWRSEELVISEAPDLVRPSVTRLLGARPNPFNPQTTIHWELADPGPVRIAVYDLAGRRVREWSLPEQPWGPGHLDWDGTDRRGARAASGVYLIRMHSDEVVETKRVTLLK